MTQHSARRRRHAEQSPFMDMEVAEEEYQMLIGKCTQIGYHPNAYHRSISPALQKPGKADYFNPRARILVHLLSTMGKWIEKLL